MFEFCWIIDKSLYFGIYFAGSVFLLILSFRFEFCPLSFGAGFLFFTVILFHILIFDMSVPCHFIFYFYRTGSLLSTDNFPKNSFLFSDTLNINILFNSF